MNFDIRALLQSNAIAFTEVGRNVKRGNINIKCPFCPDDPSMHLGIHPGKGVWGCYRNRDHKGRGYAKLVARLLGVTVDKARALTKESEAPPGTRNTIKQNLARREYVKPTFIAAQFPEEFNRPKATARILGVRRYLKKRGYPRKDHLEFCRYYGIRFAFIGDDSYRLILPVYAPSGALAGWTGRAIGHSELRYKASDQQVKRCLFNSQNAKGGKWLIAVEGPLSATRLDFYAPPGCDVVAGMGTAWLPIQVARFAKLARNYDHCGIMFDKGAQSQAAALRSALAIRRPRMFNPPVGRDDPGEMSISEVRDFWKHLLQS